ncbi:micrococcal nuclease [Salmonella enterica subsp. enterica serovar Typhimurium]|nr:micrococcal nuclease [Salmonella enterica subsp. enterica serovar Typhimurium]
MMKIAKYISFFVFLFSCSLYAAEFQGKQLKTLLAGQSVTVSYTQTDRYGRIIGRVFTTNGTDASRFMVQSGAAWVYARYNTDKSLPALQREAQEQKRGLWADPNPVPPWEWRNEN